MSPKNACLLINENRAMTDIPKWAISRSVKLASLPIGVAGRGAVGLGKRIGGRPAELVATELQQRTAEQLFKVLGELKGGAMKFGQALSVFEAALPEELAAPYRAALTKLQDAAPPMPPPTVHKVLVAGLGADWREKFV
jgi:predicted unusual protein kinase regulating ubiquinone biosynthesis (AarF/ABC1/UbiB family)